MEAELESIIKVWILALISLSYCFYLSSKLPSGVSRLISLVPVFILFLYLPLITISSAHLAGLTAFFLSWLANFKLLLFAFDQPPLSPPPPTLFRFISLASLPIKPKRATPSPKINLVRHKSSVPTRAIFGFELEPQFNEPYLASSLQDFWGHRWNLMVTSILRPTVYYPIRRISARVLGPVWVSLPAIVAVFVVSGLMHELIYYYLTRVAPTWEVTWFFILHGVALAVEVAVKKVLVLPERLRLHPAVSGALTLGFVAVTAFWLFFPQLLRNGVDDRIIGDYSKLVDFLKGWLPFHLD
ncbi:hypothetical protein V6N11_052151 [Hibiscus sabdariffa]|uniref:Wax synthase domain-containing protein n=1 Tax=Hibiscus sabdariffa TaxID=183260 RepID=A0ABR2U950_9ROSI